jgi:mono/diheme cytochrome c family protein
MLLLLTAVLTACPKDTEQPPTPTPVSPVNGSTNSENVLDRSAMEALYNKNCAICHGKDMEGRPGMAPDLNHAKGPWKSAEELVKYLQDPQGYADKDPRLSAQRDKYSLRMPAIPTMTDEERLAMAKWLIDR